MLENYFKGFDVGETPLYEVGKYGKVWKMIKEVTIWNHILQDK